MTTQYISVEFQGSATKSAEIAEAIRELMLAESIENFNVEMVDGPEQDWADEDDFADEDEYDYD
jgi:hypothetical protein